MPVGAISLGEWAFRSARPSWRQRSDSATGRPTPLSVKGTVEQSYPWLIGSRNTHCWDGWTKKTKEAVCSTLIRLPGSDEIPVHTITADNGKEFADHSRVANALKAQFFFARPCHSWERGLNEHTNGLVREYFPKGTDFRKVSDEEVQKVQGRLNARPRKVLGYRTPTEAMFGLEVKPYTNERMR